MVCHGLIDRDSIVIYDMFMRHSSSLWYCMYRYVFINRERGGKDWQVDGYMDRLSQIETGYSVNMSWYELIHIDINWIELIHTDMKWTFALILWYMICTVCLYILYHVYVYIFYHVYVYIMSCICTYIISCIRIYLWLFTYIYIYMTYIYIYIWHIYIYMCVFYMYVFTMIGVHVMILLSLA